MKPHCERYYHIHFIDEEIWDTTTLRNLFKVCHPVSSRTGIQTHVFIAPKYSLKICVCFFCLFVFYIIMLSSLRNKKHCPGPFVNKQVPTSDSSRAQCQMNWGWALMVMRARKGFPVPDWIKPAFAPFHSSFSSIEPAEHLFHLSEQRFQISDSSISFELLWWL